MIAGVDGYKDGWIVAIDLGDGTTQIRCVQQFPSLLTDLHLSTIVIDIPIGLLPSGVRQCDQLARRLLGRPRGSSVFPASIRPMLDASTWEEACQIGFELEGKKCSKQAWGILPKIYEVDRVITPELQRVVREGHPEVSFAMMNSGRPMAYKKSTREGKQERLNLLTRNFSDVGERLSSFKPRSATVDIIDAYACLWTARRIDRNEAIHYPPIPQYDERGLKAEIVA